MLAQKYRFHGYGSLKYVFKHGDKARDKYLVMRVTTNPRRHHSRVAVIVSKKIHKSAVVRNRIRRRLYEIVRHELSAYRAVHDIVITVVSPEVIMASHQDLTKSSQQLAAQLGLYTEG